MEIDYRKAKEIWDLDPDIYLEGLFHYIGKNLDKDSALGVAQCYKEYALANRSLEAWEDMWTNKIQKYLPETLSQEDLKLLVEEGRDSSLVILSQMKEGARDEGIKEIIGKLYSNMFSVCKHTIEPEEIKIE